ncbi:hypothetical protein [Sphingopyxis macrogoltabida]|uniref:Uncharacterized protein n=1 Tax=Sphingopyxis macrogoltabida TaxID=33050 RepID=A0AAC9FGM6_SPHMC|nr:hypothetical protein [Sphingopyxis macrogoltabida]ALJ15371.1 hypothetical protein LH19_21050 [Sphingopyxis macrogoltabida]AMU91620.1 hypothetical protein ATM17_21630 [Sphingopyxis macrogoltabida]
MNAEQLIGAAPWAVATFALTWAWQVYVHRDARRERREAKAAEVEQHRDDLTLKLIKTATDEAAQVRKEIEEVRQENKALRALEEHFYHFEQALNHLEAVLTATDADARKVAEKNANAFLTRMRRLQQAKGNIQQEVQIIESASRLEGRDKP